MKKASVESIKKRSKRKAKKSQILFVIPSQETFPECSHYFGYLKNRVKNTPVPQECFRCIKAADCLFQE